MYAKKRDCIEFRFMSHASHVFHVTMRRSNFGVMRKTIASCSQSDGRSLCTNNYCRVGPPKNNLAAIYGKPIPQRKNNGHYCLIKQSMCPYGISTVFSLLSPTHIFAAVCRYEEDEPLALTLSLSLSHCLRPFHSLFSCFHTFTERERLFSFIPTWHHEKGREGERDR